MKTPRLILLLLIVLFACATSQASTSAIQPPPPAAPCPPEYTALATAYGQLLGFQDEPSFLRHGFTANSPYAGWLDQVRALGKTPGYSPEGPHHLAMLAVAIKRHGKNSDIARDFTTQFERELRLVRHKPVPPDATPPARTPVTILYTGDTQGVLCPQSVHDSSVGGLARRAPLVAELRTAASPTLLLDAGDAFSSARAMATTNNAIVVTAMNHMRYDVMGLGPHDLAVGENRLRQLAKQAEFPFICSNLVLTGSADWIKPYALIPRGPVTVAVLSLLPPTAEINLTGATRITAREALQRYIPIVEDKSDLIIVLTQTPLPELGIEQAEFGNIDAIIGDARGQAIMTPVHVFPAMAKGLAVGEIRLDAENGNLIHQAMHLLDVPTFDPELEKIVEARK